MLQPSDLTIGVFTSCDGCHVDRIVDCSSVSEALEVLEVDGWSYHGHQRLCPRCSIDRSRRARIWKDLIFPDEGPVIDLPDLTMYVVTCVFCPTQGKYLCRSARDAGNHFSDEGWSVVWGQIRCPDCERMRQG